MLETGFENLDSVETVPPASENGVSISRIERRLLDANGQILSEPPDRNDFLHTVMCQVGMPRRATDARTFERSSGPFSVSLEAGRLWNGFDWIDQPLPYGTTPRLVMVHLSSEAVRTQCRTVELGSNSSIGSV